MSGRKITDMGGYPHTSDMAMKSKNRVTHEHSCEGAGHVGSSYPDTTEDIHRDQEAGVRHAEGRKMKPGYRY
jgi:hypothetical protein